MTCREAERLVTPYIQDKLSGDELEAFLEHLEHCRNCQEDVGLKQLDTGSGTFDIMGALQKRIAESYARVRRMWRFRKMEYAVNTLGVMAVLVTVMLQVRIWLAP